MPTRPLPPGTCNGSVNLPIPMWRQFCRLAAMSDESAGQRLRALIHDDLTRARARGMQLVHDARQMVLPLAACFVIVAGLLATAVAALAGENELRRPGAFARAATSVVSLKIRHRREGRAA